jgi:putative ABC transport system permease protein
MIKNYFKIAWRNLKNHKVYSAINIFGLAVGIAASLIIYLVIHYETSYDNFEPNKNRIYRVVSTYTNPITKEVTGRESSSATPLAKALRNDIPQIQKAAEVWNIGGAQIHIPIPGKDLSDEKRVKENDGLYFAEPGLFSIFDYKWLAGNEARLNEPNTCVLNESLAKEFFGEWKKAMGQTIQMWSFRVPLQVVGVFKDLPANTDLEIKMGASYATFQKINANWFAHDDWSSSPWPSECFLLLPEGGRAEQYSTQLQSLVKKYYPPAEKGNSNISLALQPLTDMHLNEDFGTYKGDALTHKELWSLGLIGFFLLLVACINFINLATAQSVNRAKEIGVRKVLGSSRSQILKQFLNETAVITFASVLSGFLLAQLALPFISNLMQKQLSLNLIESPSIFLFLVLLGIAVNFLAGFYPGLVLSGFRPVEAIKNKINTSSLGGISIRRGLVVFQFVIAQFLIIGTIVVLQQMQFFRNQPMGFDKNAMAFIELPSDSLDQLKYPYLKEQMLKLPGVENAGYMLDAPASFGSNNTTFYFNSEPIKKDFQVNVQFADTGYTRLFHIPITAGRIPYQTDTVNELLVNETLVRKLGINNDKDILGKTLSFDGNIKHTVVGVMHDFNSKSLKEAVTPFVLATNIHAYNYIGIRLNASAMKSTLPQMEKTFTQMYPTYMYTLDFLDERISHFYTSEAMASTLFKIAAFFAILISCLGLYGLVSFMAAQKTKEVGIRKVLGASVQSIVYLFSKEFMLLIGVAFIIAAPIGYFLMHKWLNGFYYHIALSWEVFIAAIFISVIIALLSVGYKAIQAALANPVKSLRTE